MRFAYSLLVLGTLAFLTACRPAPPPPPDLGPPPNILLLLVDCLRADHLSMNGYARKTTPMIDSLGAESVQFRHTLSQASWTRPSLPSMLTGLYPSEHGIHTFDESTEGVVRSPSLAEGVTTVAEALKEVGYRTALIGEQFQLSPRFGLKQGFDFYKHRANDAANIHNNFLRWLDRTDESGQPFFAYLHYLEIHWPYCPPKETRGKWSEGLSDIRWCRKWRELRSDILEGRLELSEGDRESMKARYDEELLALDRRLGDLFATLQERDLWEDTLIILTADHGEEFYEHGSMGHGQSLYRELIGVPLIVKPPAAWPVAVGGNNETVVEMRAIAPTLLEAAGAESLAVTAQSLVPLLLGTAQPEEQRTYAVAEAADKVVVRSGPWKMIVSRENDGAELYNLDDDPWETQNVARENREELARLRDYYELWQQNLVNAAAAEMHEVDPETVQGLKDLGYLGGQ